MIERRPETHSDKASHEGSRAAWGLLLVFLGAVVWQLKEEWARNPQYFYGWGVPILAILLFRRRWEERPAPEGPKGGKIVLLAGVAVLALWLPGRVLREANMDWRLLQWGIAAGGVGWMLGTIYWMGGGSWLRQLAFPVLFLFLAVPWPTRIENLIVQSSTAVVVRGVVEVLRWLGVAAWNAGNVIQLPRMALGVDEACSGLRSFQGALMAALFLGEMARLTHLRRLLLLLAGGAVALGLNGGRTLILALIAERRGETAVTFWHDGTGLATLGVTFVLLWLGARGLKTPRQARAGSKARGNAVPAAALAGCAAWLVMVEAASAFWFYSHERGPSRALWTFHAKEASDLEPEAIPERTQAILRYNRGEAYRRSVADGTQWWIYALAWDRDGGGSPLARFHSPEVCLPAAGLTLREEGPVLYPIGAETPFHSYEFEWLGKAVYLFSNFSSSSGGAAVTSMDQFDLTWRKRLRLARHGERPAEQKVFQVLISGASSRRAAEQSFLGFAAETLRAGQ